MRLGKVSISGRLSVRNALVLLCNNPRLLSNTGRFTVETECICVLVTVHPSKELTWALNFGNANFEVAVSMLHHHTLSRTPFIPLVLLSPQLLVPPDPANTVSFLSPAPTTA